MNFIEKTVLFHFFWVLENTLAKEYIAIFWSKWTMTDFHFLKKKVCQCPKVLAANILPGVFALCLIISFSKIWKNSEILDFSPIFGNLPVKKLNFAVFWWGYYILDNINTALAKSNFINMAPIFGSRSDKYGSYFEFWSRQSSISLIIYSSLQTYGIIHGGRSCVGARGALAEKFGLGRKF